MGCNGASSSKMGASFNADDVKVVLDLFTSFTEGDCDQLLSKVLSTEFGRLLEEKFNEFQTSKAGLKESIRKNIGESAVPKTPKRQKPTAILLERIHQFKMISFLPDDQSPTSTIGGVKSLATKKQVVVEKGRVLAASCANAPPSQRILARGLGVKTFVSNSTTTTVSSTTRGRPKRIGKAPAPSESTPKSATATIAGDKKLADSTPQIPQESADLNRGEMDPDPYAMEITSPEGAGHAVKTGGGQQKGKHKKVPFTPSQKPQPVFTGVHSTTRPVGLTNSNKRIRSSSIIRKKSLQLKKLEEKATSALRQKEELLKDKAERAKRDREERRLRVEQNNRMKESEQREKEQQLKAHEERLREFRQEQERLQHQHPQAKSPAPIGHHHHAQPLHPALNRILSNVSSASTVKIESTAANRTPVEPNRSAAKDFPPKPIFRPGPIHPLSQKHKAELRKQPRPRTVVDRAVLSTPPLDAKQKTVVASAGGSTTPYPHQLRDDHADEGTIIKEKSIVIEEAPNPTPKLITPRQIAIPPKKSTTAAGTAKPSNIAKAPEIVVEQPRRKVALTTAERARQREAEKLKLEKEMKAVREREEALVNSLLLEAKRKLKEEEEEKRHLAIAEEEKAKSEKEEREKKKIQEAVEQAEKELAVKRKAMMLADAKSKIADQKKHIGSPFLPPGLPKTLAHVSIVESIDGESVDYSREGTSIKLAKAEITVKHKIVVEEKSYDGSISDDLTASSASPAATQKTPGNHHNHDEEAKENKDSNKAVAARSAASSSKPAAVMKLINTNKSSYDMTPDKVFLPSTEENYNVDDLSSNDETDNEDNPRKDVPEWARRSNLVRDHAVVKRNLTCQQISHHFGKIMPPVAPEIFPNAPKDYGNRSESAIWASPLSDPTPGEAKFLTFKSGLNSKG